MKLHRLGIDIVKGCNLKCVGCPNSTLDRKIEFTSVRDFNFYLSQINVSSIKFFKLYNFGESLLHPQFGEILERIKKQEFKVKHVEISTNGQILNYENIEAIFKSGIVTRLGISVDGDCTKEEYEKLRVGAKWERFINFVKIANEYNIKYGSKVKIFFKILRTGNKREWKKLARSYGCSIQWRKWRKAPDSVKYENAKIKKVNGICRHVKSSRIRCYVDWDGAVVPCCNHPRAQVFGYLKKRRLTDIYCGKIRGNFEMTLMTHRKKHKICGRCEVL